MKHNKITISLIFLILVAGNLFLSCSDDPIFASIQREDLLDDGDMENAITLIAMDRLHGPVSGNSDDYYIAAGKRVWYEPVDQTSSWSKLPRPDSPFDSDTSGCSAMVIHTDSSGNEIILTAYYEQPLEGSSALVTMSDPETPVWNIITSSVADEATVDDEESYYRYSLFDSGNGTFIQLLRYEIVDSDQSQVRDSEVYYFASGTDIDLTAPTVVDLGLSHNAVILNGAVWNGTTHLLIVNDYTDYEDENITKHLLSWDGSTSDAWTGPDDLNSSDMEIYNAVTYQTNSVGESVTLVASTEVNDDDHFIYAAMDNAGTLEWLKISTDFKTIHFENIMPLSNEILGTTDDSSTVDDETEYVDIVLLSTSAYVDSGTSVDGEGYKELHITDLDVTQNGEDDDDDDDYCIEFESNTFSDDDNYDSTGDDLQETTIQFTFFDSEESSYPLWAATYNKGLWKNELEDSVREWVWE